VKTEKWSGGDQWVQETAGASEVSEEVLTQENRCKKRQNRTGDKKKVQKVHDAEQTAKERDKESNVVSDITVGYRGAPMMLWP